VRRCAKELVKPELVAAVLARPAVAERWPLPEDNNPPAWFVLHYLFAAMDPFPSGKPLSFWRRPERHYWPGEAASLDVARWAACAVERCCGPGVSTWMMKGADEDGFIRDVNVEDEHGTRRYPGAGLALLYLTEREVIRERDKPRIAIDAGKAHHGLLTGWRVQAGRKGTGAMADRPFDSTEEEGRLLLLPREAKADAQLALPLEGCALQDATVRELRRLLSWEGLRHWAALLRLLSVEGGRRGYVRWTLTGHLDALGYSARERRNPVTLARVAHLVERLTYLDLVLYHPDGRERVRAPLLTVGAKYDKIAGSRWRMDGMEVRLNEWLYRGIRNPDTGELGCDWLSVPVELARMDHVHHRHALALGLLLPIRLRWALGDGLDYVPLKGYHVLALAGIPWCEGHPGRAWEPLDHAIAELQRIGEVDRVTWDDGKPSRSGTCRLYPAPALLDPFRGVLPVERPPAELPATGAELRAWRLAHGWPQAELARRVGMGQATVSEAEGRGAAALPPRLRDALALALA
jgi:hypothetical protein